MHTRKEETAAAVRGICTTAAETGGGSLSTIAKVGGQHINELRVCRWLRQRMSCDPIKQAVIRLSPTRLHKGSEIPFHAVSGSMKILCRLAIESFRDQQDILRLLLHLFQHIHGKVKPRQLSGYTQETQQTFSVQRHVLFKFRNVTN